MAHSFTSLKVLAQCPRQYHEVRVQRLHPYVQGKEAARGDACHKALEHYGKSMSLSIVGPECFEEYHGLPPKPQAVPIARDDERFEHRYAMALDMIDVLDKKGTRYEHEFSLDVDGVPCGARDWSRKYWTGKADVLEIVGPNAFVADWKFGKSGFPDIDQLELMAMFTFLEFPQVQVVSGLIVFLEDESTFPKAGDTPARWTRAVDLPMLRDKWNAKANEVATRTVTGVWDARPNNLCGWCPCITCPNHAPAAQRRQQKEAAKAARSS